MSLRIVTYALGAYIAYRVIKSVFTPKASCSDLESRLVDPIRNNEPDNYATLISGITEGRHKRNMEVAYHTLRHAGYSPDNIYVLDYKGQKRGTYPVDGPATKEAIQSLFSYLAKKIDEKDFMFLYVTDHGGRPYVRKGWRVFRECSLELPGKEMLASEFEESFTQIKAKMGVLIFDQCHSGGFAERLGKGRYAAISACTESESSLSNTFPMAFYKAFRSVSADQNNDGKISIDEAFNYALRKDIATILEKQTPQIFSKYSLKNVFLRNSRC